MPPPPLDIFEFLKRNMQHSEGGFNHKINLIKSDLAVISPPTAESALLVGATRGKVLPEMP